MVHFLPLTFSKVRGRLGDIVKMNTRDYPIYRHPEIVLLLLFFETIDLVIFIKMSIKYWPSLIFGHNKWCRICVLAKIDSNDKTCFYKNTTIFYILQPDGELCYGCGDLIVDRYLLRVNDQSYHLSCLRCCVCQIGLERQSSCYIKGNNVYCKMDYTR